MPVYEFLCPSCNTIYSFHSFKVATDRVPSCPKCGSGDLERVPSRFGVSSPGKSATSDVGDGDGAGLDDPRMEREMMRLASSSS